MRNFFSKFTVSSIDWGLWSQRAGIAANFALPVGLMIAFFLAGFSILPLPGSVLELFGENFALVWAQVFFWSSAMITVGLVTQIVRPQTNLYIWFEYPGFIMAAMFALVYAGALIIRFGFGPSIIPIAFAAVVGLRFLFRWFEIHCKLQAFFKDPKKHAIER